MTERAPTPASPAPRAVLVVKTAGIGDCVNALPAVRALGAAWPGTRIVWAIERAALPAVEGQARVDAWVVLRDGAPSPRRPLEALWILRALRREGCDAALVLHRARPWRLLAWLAGARRRVGLARRAGDRAALTEAVVDDPGVLEGERYLRAASALVGRPLARGPERWTPSPAAGARAATLLASWGYGGARPLAVLAPGGGANARTRFERKRWGDQHFRVLARLLGEEGYDVALCGVPSELQAFRDAEGPHLRLALGDLGTAGALLARARVCVANDSVLLHLSADAGTPTVGVFGPTSARVWGPWGTRTAVVRRDLPCSPCYRDDGIVPPCPHDHACMRDLAPAEVLAAVRRVTEDLG